MARGIAHVTLVGNLTRDPELRQTPNGTSVCQLGVAVNSSYKDGSGQWVEKPNFFDVVVWGQQGENCARYLTKGRQVAVDGRLDQRTWEAQDGGKRSKVEVIADTVMFIGGQGETREPVNRGGAQAPSGGAAAQDDFRDIDFGGDDIPF
ncbi:MAG: single-stranded DNA-binding protein [Thermoleophilia bacterium]|nr:single-stranded DNA-binding protein [Thermoleophilia bacterium]